MNKVKIWDNVNSQWLEPMVIYFGKDSVVWKVTCCKPGEDPLSDGWYDLMGDDLKHIAIVGDIEYNRIIIPFKERNKFNDDWERI